MNDTPGLLPIGHRIYTISVEQTGTYAVPDGKPACEYTLKPVVNHVHEIRIGRAMHGNGFNEQYGPMATGQTDVTYIAVPPGTDVVMPYNVFSPYKDHLLYHGSTAGVENRGYLSLTQLYPYAIMLKMFIEKEWPDAKSVVISPEIPKGDRRK